MEQCKQGKSDVTGGGVYLERLLPVLRADAVSEGLGDGARPRLGVRAGVQPLLDVLEGSPRRPRPGTGGGARELAGLPMPLPLRRGGEAGWRSRAEEGIRFRGV